MKKFILGSGCLLLLVSSAGAQKENKDPKQVVFPQIKFDRQVYDFGQTSLVQSVTGTFTFQNVGDGVLEVRRPTTSCGCTVAAVKPDKLERGQKGELVFTLNLTGMSRGKVSKQISVPTNDSQAPSVPLTVQVELVSNYDVAPLEVNFGSLRSGTATNVAVVVKRIDGQPLQIAMAKPSSDLLRARVEPLRDQAESAAKVWIEIAAPEQLGRVSEQVVLTGVDAATIVSIPVRGAIVGEVLVAPESVFWGITDPASWPGAFPELMSKRTLRVALTNPGRSLELRNPQTTVPDLELSVVTVEAGKVFDIVAQLKQAPQATVRGTISFETNVAGQPTLTVPVLINVLKRNNL